MPPKRTRVRKDNTTVFAHTSRGRVSGLRCSSTYGNDDYYKFTRVRYAQVPDGDLRFANPKEIATFEEKNFDECDDTKKTNGREEKKDNKRKNEGETGKKNEEDCLFLHIYTPELRPDKSNEHYTRPVIVFVPSLHSDQSETLYGGEFLMAEDVVLVVLCHRQDKLGFTGFDEPNKELNITGDAGFQDIIKGFEFVKEEIRHFGGCPGNITAYGQGMSCAYIRWLTLAPYSGEYFHKMILSSSTEHSLRRTLQRCQYDLRKVAKKIGPDEEFDDDKACVEYLRKVPVEKLISSSDSTNEVEDLIVVRKNNLLAVEGDIYGVKMPVLIGFNAMEGLNDLQHHCGPFDRLNSFLWLLFLAQIYSTYDEAGANALSVVEFYKKHLNKIGPNQKNIRYGMITTDISYVIGILHLATNLAQDMDPEKVYLYKFSTSLALDRMKNLNGRQFYPGNPPCVKWLKEMGQYNKLEEEDKWKCSSSIIIENTWIQFRNGQRKYGVKLLSLPEETEEDTDGEHDLERAAERGTNESLDDASVDDSRVPTRLYTILPKEKSNGHISAYTGKGRIEGDVCLYNDNEYYSFQHVPYAQVPVGNLRFAAPQDISSFEDVKRSELDQNGRYGIEDELFLHIYTPEVRPEASQESYTRPVIVFVPSQLTFKAKQYKSEDLYGPQFLLQEDVVLVVLSYRRGILGFTAFEKPNAELDVPIDAGVQDLIKAFSFVKKEIRHFGGCPRNVTAYGHGTGATYVRMIAAKYGKRKLFHKMILSSSLEHASGIELPKNRYRVRFLFSKVSPEDDADDKTCIEVLRKLPAEKLLNMDSPSQDEQDRVLRIKHLRPLLTTTRYETTMPVLIGYNSMEGLLDPVTLNRYHKNLYEAEYEAIKMNLALVKVGQSSRKDASRNLQTAIDETIPFYNLLAKIDDKTKKYLTEIMLSDFNYNVGTIALATHFARVMAPENVYLYRFGVDLECNFTARLYDTDSCNEAAHGDELGYIFKTPITEYVRKGSLNDDAIKRMTKLWAQFARTGNPNPEKSSRLLDVKWRPVGKKLTNCFHINTTSVSHKKIPEMEVQRFKFWENLTDLNFFSGPLRMADSGKMEKGPDGESNTFFSNVRRKDGDDKKKMERRR